jgi:tetratricopeptide (TPR) repeat protein
LTRERLTAGAAALLLAGAAFRGGDVVWVGLAALVLALALAAGPLLGRAPRPAVTPLGLAAIGLLAAFVAWNGVSVLWSTRPDRTWDYLNLGLVYLAFLACGVLVGARVRPAAMAAGLAAVLGAVVVWSLAGKVFPGLYPDYERVARLRAPVGYWNALALLGDFALPLGLWVATRTRARVAGVLLVYGWTLAILLAFSRGGVLVAVAVVAVWLALDARRLESLAALALGVVPAAVVAAIAFRLDGIVEDGQSAAVRAHDGWVFGLVLLAGAAVAAAAALVRVPAARRRMAERALLVLVGAAIVAAAVGLALESGRFWQEFSSSQPVGSGAGRISSAGSNFRLTWWKQAARGFADRPVLGSGAGSFEYTNLRLRTSSFDRTIEPHDLPLQFLSETGIVGFLLAAGAVLLGFLAIRRRRLPEELALALVPLAYVLHGLLDYDWDFLAVSGPALFSSGVLLARPGERLARSHLGAVAAASGAVAVFGSLLLPWLANRDYVAAIGAPPALAAELTREAHSLNPLAVEPLFVQADAQYALGNRRRAWALYLQAAEIQPDNKETWFRLGQFEFAPPPEGLGCPQLALPHLRRFVELDPQGPGGEVYNAALDAVNSGTARC